MNSEQVIEQFEVPVRKWFARRVTDPGDAEDLAQDTMCAVIESLGRFRGHSSVRTWVFAIARNILLKYMRGPRRTIVPLDQMTEPADRDGDRISPEDRLAVQIAVSHLPVRLRVVYNLRYIEGLTTAAIATKVDRSEGTIKYQLYEIRQRIIDSVK